MNSSDIKAFIDFDKVAEYRKSMGYYQIVTSELTMEPREVIDRYHGLTQIEDQFRVMKGDLDTRPFYVRTPEHIDAHSVEDHSEKDYSLRTHPGRYRCLLEYGA